jgi:outer membrane protein assembly factor BamB
MNHIANTVYNNVSSLQIADTPWPKFQHDIANTGQSPYLSNSDGTLKWIFPAGGSINSSPVIDANGVIYFGCSSDKSLYAINPDGTLKWTYPTLNMIFSSPAIDSVGTIYIHSSDGNLYAINPNGTLKWSVGGGGSSFGNSPTIGSDGTIYTGALAAINSNGTLKWSYPIGGQVHALSSCAIDPNGIIYIGSSNFKLYAIYPNGALKWTYTAGGGIRQSPAIGSDGTIYFGCADSKLYAINPDGTLKWTYITSNSIDACPAIDSDNTIYVGNEDGNFYAINPDGSQKWIFAAADVIISSPAIDSNKTIYFGTTAGSNFYAINSDGTLKWVYPDIDTYASACINSDGTIYIGANDSKLYAFRSISSQCPISLKYLGNDVTLKATPKDGTAPYDVTFSISHNPTELPYTIPSIRLGGLSNPVPSASENVQITRVYTLDDADIISATTGAIRFSVHIEDSCPTGHLTCDQYCDVAIGCYAPVCNFVVT